jgi:3-phosphoshikimate 1-carboxyvinyltransferase
MLFFKGFTRNNCKKYCCILRLNVSGRLVFFRGSFIRISMSTQTALISRKTSQFSGRTKVPGDKSISHRALMFGALTVGETIISGLLEGEDVLCTAQAMREMGAKIEKCSDGLWRVHGVGIGGLKQPNCELEMGNSGTSTRLLIGLVGGHNIEATFVGDASLSGRPMGRVMKPLEMMGAEFEAQEGGRLPLTVKGADDTLAIEYRLPVASAQVKSAVLLAGLNARGTTSVIEEKPTRDHTEKMLRAWMTGRVRLALLVSRLCSLARLMCRVIRARRRFRLWRRR